MWRHRGDGGEGGRWEKRHETCILWGEEWEKFREKEEDLTLDVSKMSEREWKRNFTLGFGKMWEEVEWQRQKSRGKGRQTDRESDKESRYGAERVGCTSQLYDSPLGMMLLSNKSILWWVPLGENLEEIPSQKGNILDLGLDLLSMSK